MKINILGKPYTIKELDRDAEGGANLLGAANRGRQLITLYVDALAPEQYEDTLLHEVLHIIDRELALELSEGVIARLACGLHSAGYRTSAVKGRRRTK